MTETKPENPAALKILSEAEVDEIAKAKLRDLDQKDTAALIDAIRALREGLEILRDRVHSDVCSDRCVSECAKARELLGGSDERS